MKVYIAGKITDLPLILCKQKFDDIEIQLRNLGLEPINPFKLGCKDHWTFQQCKPFNFKAIRKCHVIFMLDNYEDSPGAMAELEEAKRLNMPVYYQTAGDLRLLIEDSDNIFIANRIY